MSTIIPNATGNGGYDRRLLIKGASEMVMSACTHYLDENCQSQPVNDQIKSIVNDQIITYAKQALRTIVIAYKDLEPEEHGVNHDEPVDEDVKNVEKNNLTLIGVIGIMDILRSEVPPAVETCKGAGVIVRMVTGDNIVTAKAIARQCNILND